MLPEISSRTRRGSSRKRLMSSLTELRRHDPSRGVMCNDVHVADRSRASELVNLASHLTDKFGWNVTCLWMLPQGFVCLRLLQRPPPSPKVGPPTHITLPASACTTHMHKQPLKGPMPPSALANNAFARVV